MDSMKFFSPRRMTAITWGFALLLSAAVHTGLNAQDGLKTDFFLQPEARISKVGGGTAVVSGFNTGWVINKSLILGGTSFGTNYGIEPRMATTDGEVKGDFRYRGGLVGWAFQPSPSLKTSITTVVGRGKLQGIGQDNTVYADRFWVFEPMANVNLRVNRWAAISAGAGYRFVAGGEYQDFGAQDLRSPTARIGVTLGGW
ncbi:MAG: hypothetical protein ACRENP_14840 [Longimicrobiales bacterium]